MSNPLKYLICCIVLLIHTYPLKGQFFISGQDPASYKWRQIKTKEVHLIFPEEMSFYAQRIAADLESLAPIEQAELNTYIKKPFPLILHMGSNVSNAFAAYAPKRMEFFPIPPQDSYGQDWFAQLAVHEYRHVVQLQKMNQGLGKVLQYVFGQQASIALFGVFVPRWLVEGDAVVTETALSNTGRGSQASFSMPLRTQLIQKGIYSYSKAALGSYKDFVPDPYALGYHLTAYGKIKYGEELWTAVFNGIGRRAYTLSPLSIALNKNTGNKTAAFYQKAMTTFQEQWESENTGLQNNISKHIAIPPSKDYRSYKFIHPQTNNAFIALKQGLDQIDQIVEVHGKLEKRISYIGFGGTSRISVQSGLLCWDESRPDLRWQNKAAQVIQVYNLKSGRKQTIGQAHRWFAPCLSPDASKIAAVEVAEGNRYAIIIYDLEKQKVTHRLKSQDNAFFQHPTFSEDGKKVASISFRRENKSLVEFDIDSGRMTALFYSKNIDMNYPVYHGNDLFFIADFNGLSNVYQYQRSSGNVRQITYEEFGASDPQFLHKHLWYSAYTADGYIPASLNVERGVKTPLKYVQNKQFPLAEILRNQAGASLSNEEPDSIYAESKYARAKHLFNVHSWAPLYISGETQDGGIGVSALSQNLLSTSTAELGYKYDYNEERGKWIGRYTYSGWYPRISVEANYGKRNSIAFDQDNVIYPVDWNETNIIARVSLPLNLSRGVWSSFITPYIGYEFKNLAYTSPARFNFSQLNSFNTGIQWSRIQKASPKDIQSRWGQRLSLVYEKSPYQKSSSELFAAISKLYFPGIFKHHSIGIYAAYQDQKFGVYNYSSIALYPRGISNQNNQELYSIRSDYALPLAFPDWSLGKLVYLKKISAKGFFDYAHGQTKQLQTDYMTTGLEIETEAHYLRFFAPINLGLRSAYDLKNHELSFQLLFGINLYAY